MSPSCISTNQQVALMGLWLLLQTQVSVSINLFRIQCQISKLWRFYAHKHFVHNTYTCACQNITNEHAQIICMQAMDTDNGKSSLHLKVKSCKSNYFCACKIFPSFILNILLLFKFVIVEVLRGSLHIDNIWDALLFQKIVRYGFQFCEKSSNMGKL